MGWLEHSHLNNSPKAIQYLRQSADLDPSDGQTWYLLGRVYMAMRDFHNAYDSYQQAVYRDPRNATFWCSIGVLYYHMNQRRDAMDAYIRAIRINPYVSEVWYDLGTLYESSNQKPDALYAYREAAKLAPDNAQIAAQLRDLESDGVKMRQPPGSSQQMPAAQTHPVQQMQLEITSGAQPRIAHMPNRSIPPIGHMHPTVAPPHALPQHTPTEAQPAQHHAHHMLSQHPAMDPSHPRNAMHPMHQRDAPPEMAPIPSIRQPPMTAMHEVPPPAAFAQPPRPPLSAPVPLVHPPSQQMAAVTAPHLSQQLLHHQPPSAAPVPPPSMTAQQHQPPAIPMQPSASMSDAKLKPLSHTRLPHDSQLQHHRPMPQSHLQLPRLASSSSPPSTEMQQAQPVQPSQPPDHRSLPHPHPSRAPRVSEQPPIAQVQRPPASNLPPMQIQLPQMHKSSSPTSESRQKSAEVPVSGRADPGRPVATTDSGDSETNKKSQLSTDERIQDRRDVSNGADIAKASRSDMKIADKMDIQGDDKSRPAHVYSPSEGRASRDVDGRDTVLAHQGSTGDEESASARPTSRRGIADHETSAAEHSRETRQPRDSSRERDQQVGRLSDSQTHNGHPESEKPGTPERLPPIKHMAGSAGTDNIDSARDDGKTIIPPSLPLPSSNTSLPPLSDVDIGQHAPKSSVGGLASAAPNVPTGTRGHSLPPISSRSPPASGGDSTMAASSSIGLASSLTKFSKGIVHPPTTPVNKTTVPSSLPSPLPTRKNGSGGPALHARRSPRVSKPTSIPSFKPIPIPPPRYNGQMDSVPSPGSLPVLPALSSRSRHDDEKKIARESDRHISSREDMRHGSDDDPRTYRKGNSSSPKLDSEDRNRGRKSEDAPPSKSTLAMLRSAPAPKTESESSDREANFKEERRQSPNNSFERRSERMKSPNAGPHVRERSHSSKREVGTREEGGRTAKRPRLHEVNEKELSQRSYGIEGEEKPSRKLSKLNLERRNEDVGKASRINALKSEMPKFRDPKGDVSSSRSSQGKDMERSNRRDSSTRDGEDLAKPSRSAQVSDLSRPSKSMSKLGAPPQLPANTPLPSFRSERKNMNASRSAANGSSTSGLLGNQEGNRSSLSFALRSTSMSMTQIRKSAGHSSVRGSSERKEYGSSRGTEQSGSSLVAEDRADGAMSPKNSREEKRMERMPNGESAKAKLNSSELEQRKGSDLSTKEDKSGRSEIRSGAA